MGDLQKNPVDTQFIQPNNIKKFNTTFSILSQRPEGKF